MMKNPWPSKNGCPKSLGLMTGVERVQARRYSRQRVHWFKLDKDAGKLQQFLNEQKLHALDILIGIAEGHIDPAKYDY